MIRLTPLNHAGTTSDFLPVGRTTCSFQSPFAMMGELEGSFGFVVDGTPGIASRRNHLAKKLSML
jgi:hypothetical protein